MTKLLLLILMVVAPALAQQQLPSPLPRFRLAATDFVQSGMKISTIAWRADGEGGLDVTPVPCEGQFVLSFTDRKPTPFHVNSVHTILQRVELFEHVFESDNLEPLVFRVDPEGYTWVRGKGNVIIPSGAAVQSKGVGVLSDQRTFLLPPGRQSADLLAPPVIGIRQKLAVCGEQLQIAAIIRANRVPALPDGTESILVKFAFGSSLPAAGGNRVSIALVGPNGQRFKPNEATTLTWENITKEPGIQFEVPTGMTPALLEVEGIRFNILSIAIQKTQ